MTSLEMAETQRKADKAHHQQRINWLKAPNPTWACGTPVTKSERQILWDQSWGYLNNPAGQINHCHCEPRCA